MLYLDCLNSFIVLSIIIFLQLHIIKEKRSELSYQSQKVSTIQNTNDIVSVESSTNQTSLEDLRKIEIQNRIDKYGKNENRNSSFNVSFLL